MLIEKLKEQIVTNKEKYRDLFGEVEVEKDLKRIDDFRVGERERDTWRGTVKNLNFG